MTTPDLEKLASGLSGPDAERLDDLISGYDRRASFGWSLSWDGTQVLDGVAPIDCGGSNCSDHSYRFSKLVKLGLAEHRKRGWPWGKSPTAIRGSKLYRPTDLGRQVQACLRAYLIGGAG